MVMVNDATIVFRDAGDGDGDGILIIILDTTICRLCIFQVIVISHHHQDYDIALPIILSALTLIIYYSITSYCH